MGTAVGLEVGGTVTVAVGFDVGLAEGAYDGNAVGEVEGLAEGTGLGLACWHMPLGPQQEPIPSPLPGHSPTGFIPHIIS